VANSINSAIAANTAKTQTTINNNADNRVITGSDTANTLEGEANLTYDGTRLNVATGDLAVTGAEGGDAQLRLTADQGDDGADYWRLESKASDNKFNLATYASGAWVDKFTVDTSGKVLIGTSTEGDNLANNLTIADSTNCGITLRGGTSGLSSIFFADGTGAAGYVGQQVYNHANNTLKWIVNGSESMRIQSSGRVLINATYNWVSDSRFEVHSTNSNVGGFYADSTLNNYPLLVRNNRCDGATSGTLIHFLKSGGGEIGSIRATGSATSYNTTSDYRLKENVTDISDGITRLKTLKPSRFNFKSNKDTTVDGFLAHEVTAVPEAISGTKDEVATEDSTNFKKGDPIYQSIDQSKLVPLLTAALQEAIAKIETLETKVAALEAG
jgi:hypothetical protein